MPTSEPGQPGSQQGSVPSSPPAPPEPRPSASGASASAGSSAGPTPAGPTPAGSATAGRPPAGGRPGPAPGALVLGIILVIAGGVILAGRLLDITLGPNSWPLWIIVPGLAMLLGSLAIPSRAGLGLAIPGAILAMVGLVLWVQDTYDLYATWAYAWALVAPTGVGIGMIVHGIVERDRSLAVDGVRTAVVGLGLFAGFALFFEGVVGLSGHRIENLDQVLPYAAIGFGLLLVVLSLLGDRRRRAA